MKLTAEQIAKIEALVSTAEEEGYRSAIIKHEVHDLVSMSAFVCVLRGLGVDIIGRKGRGISAQDRREFLEFLRAKRAAQALEE